MDAWELVAREEIRDLVAAYTWAGDRGRPADVAACFTVNGVLDVGDHGGRWEGRSTIEHELDAVVRRIAESGERPTPVHHHVSSTSITDLTATTARVRSYYAVHSAIGLDHWGRYLDEVALDDGRWRFTLRRVTVDGAAPESRVVAERS